MIKPGEIQKKANQVGVRDQQIEKDYILSWILWGVANHEQLSKILVFKGGTVLKKVYFEDYRFSEDLDFSLVQVNTKFNFEKYIPGLANELSSYGLNLEISIAYFVCPKQ